MRTKSAITILAFLALHCFPASGQDNPFATKKSLRPKFDARVNNQIAIVTAESLRESLNNLVSVDMYYWPGIIEDGTIAHILPLDPDIGTEDTNRILNNRRVRKVLKELNDLPKEEAGAIVADEIYMALEAYKEFYDEYFYAKQETFAPGGVYDDTGIGFQISDNPNGEPTFAGTRLRLLTLVYCAGQLELKDTYPELMAVLDYALQQKAILYDSEKVHVNTATMLLGMIAIYNRQILSHSLLRTGANFPLKQRYIEMYSHERGLRPVEDAFGHPVPSDAPESILDIHVFGPMSDKAFDRIIEDVRKNN